MIVKHILLISFFYFSALFAQAQNDCSLTVKFQNIELIQGTLELQLTNDSLEFKGEKNPNLDWVRSVKVIDHTMEISFNHLPEGKYALAVFQDLNENGSLDRKKFGIPAEPFAFSNNALRKFGPPYFQQALFLISSGHNSIHINLIYRKPKKKK